jgi:formate dehydrogenase assembly factor FdhD
MEYKKIKDVVYNYKTKHEHGFTKTEIDNLLEELNINENRFNKALGVNTCMLIDGEVITYHTDVLKGVVCAIENREQNSLEWD